MTSPLDDNLSALARVDAAAVAWFGEAAGGEPVAVEGSGDDVRLRTGDGRTLRLHSARNPAGEAAAQLAEALGDRGATTIAIVGAGAGFLLDTLEVRLDRRVLVVEPTRGLALAWLRRRSWRALIDTGRLRLLVGPGYGGAAAASQFLGGAWTHLPVIVNPVLAREAPELVARARAVLDRVAREALQNADARRRFEDLAFRNTMANLPRLVQEADAAALAGAFAGRPAIVLGAGPSLDTNIQALRELQSTCLVVAADTAVVPCLKGGVTPHLAVALDPSADNARHLTRTLIPASVHLVCEASVDPAVPAAFAGRTFFFRVGHHAPWPWLEAAGLELGLVAAWGSVVTSALDIAVRCGCGPIIFGGLDLAFTGGRPYCRHTPLDEAWAWRVAAGDRVEDVWREHLHARPIVLEPAIEGGETPTAAHLVTFRDWIRDYAAAHPALRFLNVTGAGILHGGRLETAAPAAVRGGPAADLAAAVRRLRTAAPSRPRGTQVLDAAERAPVLALLEGHSEPDAAAVRLGAFRSTHTAAPPARPSGTPASVAPPSTPPAWLPDVARHLRGLHAGFTVPPAPDAPRDPARAQTALAQALACLRHLRLHQDRVLAAQPPHEPGPDAWADVPAAAQIAWPPAMRPWVDAATDAMDDALRSASPPPTEPSLPAYFLYPADARLEGPSRDDGRVLDAAEPDLADGALRTGMDALAIQCARIAVAVVGAEPGTARVIAALRASRPARLTLPAAARLHVWLACAEAPTPSGEVVVLPLLHDRATMRATTGLLTLHSARGAFVVDRRVSSGVSLFALPGSWAPDGHGRAADLPWSTIVDPVVLTGRSLAPCRLATRASQTHALVTCADGSGSWLVDGHGAIAPAEAWPTSIDGEIAYGANGRLAWRWNGGQTVHVRRTPGEPALTWDLPVAPMHALADDEHAILATSAGLWRWSGATGPRPLAAGPRLVAVHRDGGRIRAYPRPDVGPDGSRRVLERAYIWHEDAQALAERGIPVGDAVFSRSVQGAWTADVLIDASAVRLTHATGVTVWLACSGPRAAAWAGRGLVVTLLPDGEVLLFPGLIDRIEPLVRA